LDHTDEILKVILFWSYRSGPSGPLGWYKCSLQMRSFRW